MTWADNRHYEQFCKQLDTLAQNQQETNNLLRRILYPVTATHDLVQGIYCQLTWLHSSHVQHQQQQHLQAYAELVMRASMLASGAACAHRVISQACLAPKPSLMHMPLLLSHVWPAARTQETATWGLLSAFQWIKAGSNFTWQQAMCTVGAAGRLLLGLVLLALWLALAARTILVNRSRSHSPLHLPASALDPGTAANAKQGVAAIGKRQRLFGNSSHSSSSSSSSMPQECAPGTWRGGDEMQLSSHAIAARHVGVALMEGVLLPALVAAPLLQLTGGSLSAWLLLRMIWCGALHLSPGSEACVVRSCCQFGWKILGAIMGDGTKGRQEALCCLSGGSAEDRLEQEVGLEYRVVSGIGATESRGQRMGEPGAIKGAQHAVTHVDPRLEALQAQPFLSYRKWQEKRQLQQQQRQQQQAKPRCVCQQEPFQQPQYAHSSSDGGVIGAHYPGGASLETLDSHLQLQQRPISQPQHQQGQQMWVATLAAVCWPVVVSFLLPAANGYFPYMQACSISVRHTGGLLLMTALSVPFWKGST